MLDTACHVAERVVRLPKQCAGAIHDACPHTFGDACAVDFATNSRHSLTHFASFACVSPAFVFCYAIR